MDLITINYSAESKHLSVKPMSYSRAIVPTKQRNATSLSSNSSRSSRERDISPELYERRRKCLAIGGISKKPARRFPCMICKKDHRLATCNKYTGLTTHERLDLVRKLQYCVNCLAVSHTLKFCKSKKTCVNCHKRHHSSLHHSEEARLAAEKAFEKAILLPPAVASSSPPIARKQVLIPTVRLALIYNGIRRIVRALINPSQPFTTISATIAKQCKLAITNVDNKCMCGIQLGTVQNVSWQLDLQALVTDVLPLRPYPQDLKVASPFDTLLLADPDFYVSDEVHIVLAAEAYPKIIADGVMTHESGTVVAQGSVFGWTMTGSVTS